MKKTNLESKFSAPPIEYQQVLKKHPALWQLFEELRKMVEKQQAEIEELRYEVKRLQNQLQLDSHNSSKPPSTDLSRSTSPKKEVNLRSATQRKPGGQEGHPGTTLQAVAIPDHTILHRANICCYCGEGLSYLATEKIEKRQVFNFPPLQLEITEHQVDVKTCPSCHQEVKAEFPPGINQPVQYGVEVKSLTLFYQAFCKELMKEIKQRVDQVKVSHKLALPPELIRSYHQQYQHILHNALLIYPAEEVKGKPRKPHRGRKKKNNNNNKDKNLLDRLLQYETETLRFMEDFQVSFDNSLVERDREKISECFRSKEGAKYFCCIRISTVKETGEESNRPVRYGIFQTLK